jgi:uncharacterized protein (DUF427 family)
MKAHRITITPSALHVEVRVDGVTVAESDRPVLVDETGLPTGYYLRREDVRTDLLRPTSRRTTCPFKGQASYWSVEVGGRVHDDLVWSYETPTPEAEDIASLMCFYNDQRVNLTIDGELQLRPQTAWQPPARPPPPRAQEWVGSTSTAP